MPIPRLRIEDTSVIIVDVQERVLPSITDADRVTTNTAVLLRLADALEMPYLLSEWHPQEFGRTVETVESAMTDHSRRFERTSFSAAAGLLTEQMLAWRRGTVLLAGVEARGGIAQTALDLQLTGHQVFVCRDACGSVESVRFDVIWPRLTAAGVVITDITPAIFELVAEISHPGYRVCAELARMTYPTA